MTELEKQVLVERIFNRLSSQSFADWYSDSGDFGKWIVGEVDAPTKEEILTQIQRTFLI